MLFTSQSDDFQLSDTGSLLTCSASSPCETSLILQAEILLSITICILLITKALKITRSTAEWNAWLKVRMINERETRTHEEDGNRNEKLISKSNHHASMDIAQRQRVSRLFFCSGEIWDAVGRHCHWWKATIDKVRCSSNRHTMRRNTSN